jgi:hypothetical protein
MTHLREALATVLGIIGLSACAAPGYHFNAGEFHQTPNDPCQRQEVRSAGAVNWLNMKVGAPDGPAKRVASIQSPSGSGYGGALICLAFGWTPRTAARRQRRSRSPSFAGRLIENASFNVRTAA